MLKMKDLSDLSIEQLETKHGDICCDIFKLVTELKTARKLDRPHELKEKKKDRARILTALSQKQSQKKG